MKYIINLTIIYDPDCRLLMLRSNDLLTIKLSKPATRLLTELIKNNKNELTRETLIKHVWEDYGFSPSNATLSNHISELRKAFEALGVNKEILITVPRIGFKMEAEIHPETKPSQEHLSDEKVKTFDASSEKTKQESLNPSETSATKGTFYIMRKPILALSLALLSIITAMKLSGLNRDEEPVLATAQNKCNYYLLGEDKQNNEQLARALKMVANENIDCMQSSHDIYYMEARPANDILKIYFMSVCTKNTDMSYKSCHNFKLIE
ncbi:TPA: transcriptional regulator [Serratia marcescens]